MAANRTPSQPHRRVPPWSTRDAPDMKFVDKTCALIRGDIADAAARLGWLIEHEADQRRFFIGCVTAGFDCVLLHELRSGPS